MKETLAEISWKVGGQQGEGIESTGDILAAALNRAGYYLYGYRHFSSRIKGGHTNYTLRISLTPTGSVTGELDMLVAFDQETIDLNVHELRPGGLLLADAKFHPILKDKAGINMAVLPLTEIAAAHGSPVMKNMVALGATAAILGIAPDAFAIVLHDNFAKKDGQVIENNRKALQAGADFIRENTGMINRFLLPRTATAQRMFMLGNEAAALGAIAAGAKFMAAYPITPASEIMEYMIKKLPGLGGAVIQTEDEIAACAMALGANYAGARAFTATSGPGLSLMAESIGLSAMTETPLVIINTQRGGPSTGLPTKHEQSDVLAAIYNTHGDAPKVVLAPSTVEEAFYDTFEAFNIAEEYQCPVILLTDLQLSLCKQTVTPLSYDRLHIRRSQPLEGKSLPALKNPEYFKRFQVTESGISPRVVPGTKNGMHLVTGLEHDEVGKPSEALANRRAQTEKRLRKLRHLADQYNTPVYQNTPHVSCDLLVVGMSSTRGAIEEAVARLTAEGYKVNHAHLRLIHPFPVDQFAPLYQSAGKVLVVENNATAQLAGLIRMHIPDAGKMIQLLKYDGDIFRASQIYENCKEVL